MKYFINEIKDKSIPHKTLRLSTYVGGVYCIGRQQCRNILIPSQKLPVRSFLFTQSAGHTGSTIDIKANYFKLKSHTDWCVYQYRVDFAPEEDRTFIRKALLKLHREKIGAYIFDGTVLYTSNGLGDVSGAGDFVSALLQRCS